jgi:hypothetical protein
MEQLQSHIKLTAFSYMGNTCAFPYILGSPSSYMTLHLLHSEFPNIWGHPNLIFFFFSVTDFHTAWHSAERKIQKALFSIYKHYYSLDTIPSSSPTMMTDIRSNTSDPDRERRLKGGRGAETSRLLFLFWCLDTRIICVYTEINVKYIIWLWTFLLKIFFSRT